MIRMLYQGFSSMTLLSFTFERVRLRRSGGAPAPPSPAQPALPSGSTILKRLERL
jgi:hypothetical protein